MVSRALRYPVLSLLVIGLSGIAGCVSLGSSIVDAQASCSTAAPGYLEAWNCIKTKVAAGQAGLMNNAQGIRYMATGNLLAKKVRSHRMTDAKAKALLAVESAKGDAEHRHQETEIVASEMIICNYFGTMTVCN